MPIFKKLIIILFIGLFFFSCGKSDTSVAPEVPEEKAVPVITEVVELAPVEIPEYKQAMITFITGEVFVLEEGEWIYAEIGDFLEENDSIQVESDSYCEIQFGDRAVVRVESDTELALSSVFMKPGETKIGIDLAVGSVLVKVQKLMDNEKFNVKTQSAVCGVRGTEFSVKSEPGVETVLAVKEGTVTILPPELDIEELIKKAGESGETVAAILESIEASAFVVVADEEISLTEESFEEIKESVQIIMEIVEAIAVAEENEEVISEVIFETLTEAAELVTETVENKEIPVKELSAENKGNLKNIEEMRMISIPVAKAPVKDGAEKDDESETVEAAPVISLHKFSLKVIPSNAEIFLNTKTVGKGSFSGIFEEGDILTFDFISENFESQNMSFTVSEATSKQYTISLSKSRAEPVKKEENKPESQTVKEEAPAVSEISDEEDKVVEIKEIVKQREVVSEEVSFEKSTFIDSAPMEKLFDVSVIIKPSDSTLIVNGEKVVSSMFTGSFPEGTKLQIAGNRNGFTSESLIVSVGTESSERITLNLKPRPIEAVLPISESKLVGSITVGADMFFSSDSQGTVSASTVDGKIVWSVRTENKSVENSYPVFMGNRIYFSGSNEFVIIDAVSGKLIDRKNLDKNSAHIFGRRFVPMGTEGLFPANEEIRIIGRNNGNAVRSISLPGNGSRMTPAVWNGRILSVDQNGTLSIIDAAGGSVEAEIPTGGVQPIALSIAVINDLAVFSGRKGNVVCVDLIAKKVLWERQLNGSGVKVQVYSDIIANNIGAYIYSKGIIFSLDLDTGKDLFESVKNVSSSPAIINNTLVFGDNNNNLLFIDPVDGRVKKSLNLGYTISTRPVGLDGRIGVGTSGGKMVIINPEGIR